MPIAYQKDIKLYITIEALERIKHLFRNVKGIKSRLHKLFMIGEGNHFLFDANEYTLIKKGEEKHNEKEKEKEKDKENDADKKINEAKEIDKEEQKDKKKEKKEKEKKKDTQENKKKVIEKDKQKEKNKDKQKGKSKQKGGVNEKKPSSVEQETDEEEIKEHGNETTLLQPSDVTVEEEGKEAKEREREREREGEGEGEETAAQEEANAETEEVEDKRTTEEKRKTHETIFNDKCIEDEYDLVSEEVFKSFFPDENIKFGKKYKILIEVIMQTIIYSDKIKLNIYKLNLFISIIIMTLYQIMKNLGKKKRKKKVIKYFMELLDKNTDYGTSKNEPTYENLDTENSTTIPTENVQQLPQMNDQESKSELKSELKSTLQKETVVAAEDSKESEKMEKEKKGKADVNKLGLEQEQNQEETEFILFDYREAKYIIKYMFENIFSIYNIYEYMFLFSPVPINLTFTNSSSFATSTESFTLDDKLEFDGTIPDNDKNATNSYIKEMLDVPMFVLDKFYDHIEDLREKIDDFVKRP